MSVGLSTKTPILDLVSYVFNDDKYVFASKIVYSQPKYHVLSFPVDVTLALSNYTIITGQKHTMALVAWTYFGCDCRYMWPILCLRIMLPDLIREYRNIFRHFDIKPFTSTLHIKWCRAFYVTFMLFTHMPHCAQTPFIIPLLYSAIAMCAYFHRNNNGPLAVLNSVVGVFW